MKNPITATLMMGLVAVISSGFAIFFYPWPQTVRQTEMVGEPLIEEYDYNNVRFAEIVMFDREKNAVERIRFQRSGEKWVFPDKANFLVTATTQIADLVNSLNGRTVLEVMSDQQQEHVDYGVVDPEDYEEVTGTSGLGMKLVLADRNDNEIGSLILGKGRKNDPTRLKRFVRRPGQSTVYSIEYDARMLSTDFASWVSPNLFNLQNSQNVQGNEATRVAIRNYRVDEENMGTAALEPRYAAEILLSNAGAKIGNSMVFDKDSGEMKPVQLTQQDQLELSTIGRFLPRVTFTDVISKDKELAKQLRTPKAENDLDGLLAFGFRKKGMNGNQYDIESARGRVSVLMKNGLEITLLIGAPNGRLSEFTGRPERYVILTARVEESAFVEPTPPEIQDPESSEYKAYLRAVEERRKAIKTTADIAQAANSEFAKWFYIVEETVCDGLLPDVNWKPGEPSATEPPEADEPAK